jgi:small ligand-binding sensory domain FIST
MGGASEPRFASSLSTAPETARALDEALEGLERQLEGARCDLLLAFVSPHHVPRMREIAGRLERAHPAAIRAGVSARSVIGGGCEAEEQPGIALAAAELPATRVEPLRLSPGGDPASLSGIGAKGASAILLADPFSCDVECLLRVLDEADPDGVRVGGLASGGERSGEHALLSGGEVQAGGLVGVRLQGAVSLESIVAQGCRPIGDPYFVTRARGNVALELDGRPPIDIARELYEAADPLDRELFAHSLFIGLQMRPAAGALARGDFLVRNLAGFDPQHGALVAAAPLAEGLVVQFHLRDARTSAEDLEERLERFGSRGGISPVGGLLFSCLGRGRFLYGCADHDSDLARRKLGELPLAGFFCNGEIGPVSGRTHLHAYTSSFALFCRSA